MNTRILKLVICYTLVIACMIMIFCFSAQTASESVESSNSTIKIIASFIYPDFENLSEEKQAEICEVYTGLIRKLAHLCIYALLGFLVSLTLFNYPLKVSRIILYSEIVCVVYAITDEIHQYFVPGRGPGVKDVLIDAVGSLLGSIFIICIIYIIRRIIYKQKTAN